MKKYLLILQSLNWQLATGKFVISPLGVFCLVFVGSLMAGLSIQWLVLPALPNLHAGHGLIAGGDWIWFNEQAVKLVELMRYQGWQAWELRPQGNAPIGIAAAVYFLVGISKPWVLLPLNAAMFALAAVFLYGIFTAFAPRNLAFMATLPFALFPSAAMIYSQIHKDVFSIAGTLIMVFVWVQFALPSRPSWFNVLKYFAYAVIGCLLVWVVRPYLLPILLVASLLAIVLLISMCKGRRPVWWIGILLCTLVQIGYIKFSPENIVPGAPGNSSNFMEKVVAKLDSERIGFAENYPNASSNIDIHVRFNSVTDVFLYFPRALQIGLLAPFPSMWLGNTVSPGGSVMRLVSGLETLLSYTMIAGVVLLIFRLEVNRIAFLITVLMAILMILVLALTVCNVGTLYRMRYGSLQLLNGLGILGWGLWWKR